jgi:hypothetical protein
MYDQCLVALSSALMWFHANLIMSFLYSLNRGKRCSRKSVEICVMMIIVSEMDTDKDRQKEAGQTHR